MLHSLRRPAGGGDDDGLDDGGTPSVEEDVVVFVLESDFELAARELNVSDLSPFYASSLFTGARNAMRGFRRFALSNGEPVLVRAADAHAFESMEGCASNLSIRARARPERGEAEVADAEEAAMRAALEGEPKSQQQAVAAAPADRVDARGAGPADEDGAEEGQVAEQGSREEGGEPKEDTAAMEGGTKEEASATPPPAAAVMAVVADAEEMELDRGDDVVPLAQKEE